MILKTKKIFGKMRKAAEKFLTTLLVIYMTLPISVFAASPTYIGPLTNLKTVFITIVAAAGVIVLLYGAVKFAISFQKMDQNGEHQAVYTIIAGGVMIGISAIATALGA